MKKIIGLAVLLLMVSAVKFSFAEQLPYKFGYIDFQKTLNEVEEGKKAKSMLKSEFDEKQKNLDVVQTQLQAMKTDLDKQRLILSADTLKEKEDEFRKKFMDLQQKIATYEQELKNKEAALTSNILVVVHKLVKNIGEKEGYSLILEKSQDVVIYSPVDADLTDRIIKEYNGLSKDKKDALLKAK
jgi:outer membrane protein